MACRDAAEHSAASDEITYATHIAPVIYQNCSPCHRPGEAGPFNLLSYSDVKQNANKIKFVTGTRFMPPWPADPSYRHFSEERVLSDSVIMLIKKWIEMGCPRGDSLREPEAPQPFRGSFLGKPDLVINMQQAVPIKGNGSDHFYMIKMPYQISNDTFIRAMEFVPHQRKLAHHVNGHLISYEEGKKKNPFIGQSFFPDVQDGFKDVYERMGILNDDKTLPLLTPNTVYFLPGFSPLLYPDGIGGYRFNKQGAVFLKNIHYGPSKSDCKDSSVVNVFFGPKPKRPVAESQLGTFGIAPVIPDLNLPPDEVKEVYSTWTCPKDISLLAVNPHMHLLGKSFWAYAIEPNGDTIPLIRIPKWDFRWQYYYKFIHPVHIKAGTQIWARGVYDNTSKNPNNPYQPPQYIKERSDFQSMGTKEEMFQFIFTYMNYLPGDEKIDLRKTNP